MSWTKDLKHATGGKFDVDIYDEEGFSALKRAGERGEDAGSVKPLTVVTVDYPGAYKGPVLNSELIAMALAFLVFWLAYSSKSALLA